MESKGYWTLQELGQEIHASLLRCGLEDGFHGSQVDCAGRFERQVDFEVDVFNKWIDRCSGEYEKVFPPEDAAIGFKKAPSQIRLLKKSGSTVLTREDGDRLMKWYIYYAKLGEWPEQIQHP